MKAVWIVVCVLVSQTLAGKLANMDEPDVQDFDGGYNNEVVSDPCENKHCGPGKVCDIDEDERAVCVCIPKCPVDEDAKVCSTTNVTFDSECELHRQKCLCHHSSPECQDRHYRKIHMDYYGPCVDIPECTDEDMVDFPVRMRNWFYHVMEELASRDDLPPPVAQMAKEAQRSNNKWVIPTIWRFCDLDMTRDSLISAEELLPITAPLKPLEHCTGPFLEKCDADRSGYISLEEWGLCLGLQADEIEDRCEALRS